MPLRRSLTVILLFDRVPIIPPSRSHFASPSRAAAVKTGRQAGAPARRGLDRSDHGGTCGRAARRLNGNSRRARSWIS
jgi:hypothetical protein